MSSKATLRQASLPMAAQPVCKPVCKLACKEAHASSSGQAVEQVDLPAHLSKVAVLVSRVVAVHTKEGTLAKCPCPVV